MRVYLAGPISGLSFREATAWRQELGFLLRRYGIEVLDPMRDKPMLAGIKCLDTDTALDPDDPIISVKSIVARDRQDVFRCDLLIANFLGGRISIGTLVEIGWADALRKPVLVIADGDVHGMVAEIAVAIVPNLDAARHVAVSYLNAYGAINE